MAIHHVVWNTWGSPCFTAQQFRAPHNATRFCSVPNFLRDGTQKSIASVLAIVSPLPECRLPSVCFESGARAALPRLGTLAGGSRAAGQRFTVMHRGVSVDSISHLMKDRCRSGSMMRHTDRLTRFQLGRFNSQRSVFTSIRIRPSVKSPARVLLPESELDLPK